MDGYIQCSRYAFGPNRLHYCGPDQNQEMYEYIQDDIVDAGLEKILSKFKTMYPYLRFIARENNIKNPIDKCVVEAYWIGNNLLENVNRARFYRYLVDDLELKKKLGNKKFSYVEGKLSKGAVPHHSFHVLDIWRQSEQFEEGHSLESLDKCRIGWGKVVSVSGPDIIIDTEDIIYENGKLMLSPVKKRTLKRKLESEYEIEQLKKGDVVSIHWDIVCEKIRPEQARLLKKYTLQHLELANETF
ncbi:MAG: hypothetical protein KAS07_02905 [Candidatus Pacebacteria bacterium]|nr:hypothetical protein [Candidatus Paceibacterota bacterium]